MERDMCLKDILILGLKKSKSILIWTVVLCLLAGGLGIGRIYIKSISSAPNEETLASAKSELDKATVKVDELNAYIERSILYNIDPYGKGFANLVLYIDTGYSINPQLSVQSPNKTQDVTLAYAFMQDDADVVAAIKAIIGADVDKKYIDELLSIEAVGESMVKISAVYNDGATAQNMVYAAYDVMEEKMQNAVAPHSVKIIADQWGSEIDTELQLAQQDVKTQLDEATAALKKSSDAYAALKSNKKESPLKYFVVGAFAGFVMGCISALCGFIFGSRLHNANEIVRCFNLPVLGLLPQCSKGRWFNKWICALENESDITYEQAAAVAGANIALAAGDDKPALVTTGDAAMLDKLMPFIDNATLCGNILCDAAAVEKLGGVKAVVIVEQRGKGNIENIKTAVQRLEALDKSIIGVVLN